MPMEMKKTLVKTSRKGATSATTWWLYSDSETTMPARKAPSASEKPRCSVKYAMPRQTSSAPSTKTSRMRVPAA